MTKARSNATAEAAKGDLRVGNGTNLSGILAVGSNGDTIVADSSTATGLRYQQQNIKNYAYNSNFDIWQRGTSFASVSGYFADRWSNVGSYSNVTVSRQTSGAAVGSYYYLRHTATGAGAYWNNVQSFETQDCEELWGKTVTLSMKVRRNATANNVGLILQFDKSSTVDAGAGASWSTVGATNIPLASIPTGTTSADWYTASLTVTVPSDGTANSLRINIAYNGGTASGTIFDFSQVMLQVGSVVTAYQRQNGTIQGELAACQRYYVRLGGSNADANQRFGVGPGVNSTTCSATFKVPVQMRVPVTSIDFSTLQLFDGTAVFAITGATLNAPSTLTPNVNCSVASGLTGKQFYEVLANNSTSGFIGFSAEL